MDALLQLKTMFAKADNKEVKQKDTKGKPGVSKKEKPEVKKDESKDKESMIEEDKK